MPASPLGAKKLREATFFLACLRKAEGTSRLDDESFDFYLSAFLSASRSFTFALQYEQKEAYDQTFPSWLASLTPEEQDVLSLLKDQRNDALKRGTTDREKDVVFVPMWILPSTQSANRPLLLPWAGDRDATIGVARYRIEVAGVQRPVLEVCSQGLALLERFMVHFAST